MTKKTILDLKDISGRTAFVRCDFNISLKNGQAVNNTRIEKALPTLNYLLQKNCRLILCSHLGRPIGADPQFSLKPVAKALSKLIKKPVHLMADFWKKEALPDIKKLKKAKIILLENIRFYPGEKANDVDFSRHLSKMADFFVNEAFGASHRVHASTVGITHFLPSVAGLLMDREIRILSKAFKNPEKPLVVFIGGAKTPEKISVIEKLLETANTVALGGAIANTFLAAWGFGLGQSMVDYEMVEMARVVFWKATRIHSALLLPVDVIVQNNAEKKVIESVDFDQVPSDATIYDIGPKTRLMYAQLIDRAKTLIWNGPMGFYENKNFRQGTDLLLKKITASVAFSIVGGGDTLACLNKKEYMDKISHVSTGGSAMLEFINKATLPGIEVLEDK
ncbi:phosphoglycerate kinase [Candidatus Gottesmanbacteria bacterium RIFCSPLOWO2_02_FULL_42_29]|uniref:Phosphoglycerate kinase n=2 Tax=Candidatus Gottesmaniibacteriota TaxID=1752720 RepID=A0A1F6B946_9BACT|nr:MAG: Phosphoglycerate kinase [Candidatus Gottesmanbacteria bacterium GW2011_GWA2_42_18]KKS74719.1 MAG: Phosphoglycerate kinase [Candidatus Gottesmanbacteria bacterium GW2011_GWC2_42_8]OGG10058.1 MAG: phosphoglycerate kinase [Candidatus Gottesmanbacteria bacterium RIFCSPHIGHO2_01_FULL_42_27]OGG20317.1 MAG: phosphoglycerate kinase [Candidatus Gottesmanbacteria bacterium RIFCSPHIGHO2_12_FULL_43_26]OGG33454.1 MAG: phosphoglycerate kinase [Candidatus Gottesmanbacteria bacterium RIFCSPLOWO2_01_FUL